jgi:glyoxylase I family protein
LTKASAAVGGVFLATRNVPRLVKWYRDLGLPLGDDGTCIQAPDGSPGKPPNAIVFSIQPAQGELPPTGGDLREEPYGRQRTMLNVRVEDLATVLGHLRAKDFPVVGPKDVGYGLFAWVKDPDGNLVELWQAVKSPR